MHCLSHEFKSRPNPEVGHATVYNNVYVWRILSKYESIKINLLSPHDALKHHFISQ